MLQGIQKYYYSLFNKANNGICFLTGTGTFCSLVLRGAKELYRYRITTMHIGLSPFITLDHGFLTGYKEICVLSTLCQDTLKEEEEEV